MNREILMTKIGQYKRKMKAYSHITIFKEDISECV